MRGEHLRTVESLADERHMELLAATDELVGHDRWEFHTLAELADDLFEVHNFVLDGEPAAIVLPILDRALVRLGELRRRDLAENRLHRSVRAGVRGEVPA